MRPRVGARRSAAQVHVSAIDNPITVALAGQPNVGKSTVFNMLTGLSQHVGNWPGKTIEQKIGVVMQLSFSWSICLARLTANSEEERIARDFILRQRPDAVVVIVNAATLERNLYLIAELLALPAPLVIGLNMTDVAERHGIYIEPHVLAAALGMPVVPLVASKNQGLRELVEAVRVRISGMRTRIGCVHRRARAPALARHRGAGPRFTSSREVLGLSRIGSPEIAGGCGNHAAMRGVADV
jgi:ferrous iron transport protein B